MVYTNPDERIEEVTKEELEKLLKKINKNQRQYALYNVWEIKRKIKIEHKKKKVEIEEYDGYKIQL